MRAPDVASALAVPGGFLRKSTVLYLTKGGGGIRSKDVVRFKTARTLDERRSLHAFTGGMEVLGDIEGVTDAIEDVYAKTLDSAPESSSHGVVQLLDLLCGVIA